MPTTSNVRPQIFYEIFERCSPKKAIFSSFHVLPCYWQKSLINTLSMRNTSVNIIFQYFIEFYNLRYLKDIGKIKESIYSFSHSLDIFVRKKFIILPNFSIDFV